jgi:hypothetical protein
VQECRPGYEFHTNPRAVDVADLFDTESDTVLKAAVTAMLAFELARFANQFRESECYVDTEVAWPHSRLSRPHS